MESPWVTLTRKDVSFGGLRENYFTLELPDYVAIVARTPSGQLPLVRQYRPAIEQFTLELPAGTVDPGESPVECCVRELREEVGLEARLVKQVGSYWPDTGRLGNQQHVFLVETEDEPTPSQESELEVVYVNAAELQTLIDKGEFRALLHISALYLAGVLPHQ